MGTKHRVEQGMLYGVLVCNEAATWLAREWPRGVTVREFWTQCNVASWLAYFAWAAAEKTEHPTKEALEELWDEVIALTGNPEDGEARADLASAIRRIVPLPLIEELVAELVDMEEKYRAEEARGGGWW